MGSSSSLMDEHFVQIPDFPAYEVSNYGRVVNTKSGLDVAQTADSTGTLYVALFNRGRTKVALRRLVAQGFFADYKPWMPVYLLSEDRSDCSVLNITLKSPEARTTGEFIRINELGEEFPTAYDAAQRIQGSPGVIKKCLMGMGRTHKGYTFSKIIRG